MVARTKKLIVLDHCGDADTHGGQRRFDADDSGREAHAHGFGQSDVRRKRKRHLELGPGHQNAVHIKKHAAGADVLCFRLQILLCDVNRGGQAHIESPHHPPFLRKYWHLHAVGNPHRSEPIHFPMERRCSDCTYAKLVTTIYRTSSEMQEQKRSGRNKIDKFLQPPGRFGFSDFSGSGILVAVRLHLRNLVPWAAGRSLDLGIHAMF